MNASPCSGPSIHGDGDVERLVGSLKEVRQRSSLRYKLARALNVAWIESEDAALTSQGENRGSVARRSKTWNMGIIAERTRGRPRALCCGVLECVFRAQGV